MSLLPKRTQYVASHRVTYSPRLTENSLCAGATANVVCSDSSYAGQAVCFIFVFYTVRPASFGTHCLRLTHLFGDRNNRMDLNDEPPTTYVTTMDVSVDSPTRRYVFSVHFPDSEQQQC